MTRRSYDLIAEDYDARNTGDPTAEFAAWADAWVADVLADVPAGLAPVTGDAVGGGHGGGDADRGGPDRGPDGGADGGGPDGGGPDGGPDGGGPDGGGADGGADGTGNRGSAVAGETAPAVLDVGAGPGHFAARFAGAGLRAVALDLSDAMVALARDRGVPVVRGDLRRLPFGDGAFGGVWSSASLLHVPREDAPATLREWRRVTAPGGHLALSTASGGTDGWEDPPYDTRGERPPPRWFVYHDEPALRSLLEEAGWSVESVSMRTSHRTWLQVRARAARG